MIFDIQIEFFFDIQIVNVQKICILIEIYVAIVIPAL